MGVVVVMKVLMGMIVVPEGVKGLTVRVVTNRLVIMLVRNLVHPGGEVHQPDGLLQLNQSRCSSLRMDLRFLRVHPLRMIRSHLFQQAPRLTLVCCRGMK